MVSLLVPRRKNKRSLLLKRILIEECVILVVVLYVLVHTSRISTHLLTVPVRCPVHTVLYLYKYVCTVLYLYLYKTAH